MPLTAGEKLARKREAARRHYQRHKKEIREYGQKYKEQNKERIRERNRVYREQHKEQRREYNRLYDQRNPETPEQRARRLVLRRAAYLRNKDKVLNYNREYHRKTKPWRRQQEDKAGRVRPELCEICGRKPNKRALNFDHCHQRGVFRGWICDNCNRALGLVHDDANHLRKLIAYLERTKDLVSPQLSLPGM